MIIYSAFLVPILTALYLYFFQQRKTLWWEFFTPIAASAITIFILKALIDTAMVRSDEYWGSIVQRVEYYEEWDQRIHRTCSEKYGCNSKGQNCKTRYYNCDYTVNHAAYWIIITTNNEEIRIDRNEYNRLKRIFDNEQFVDMHRNYYTIDGDKYYTQWDGSKDKAVPVTTSHSYVNKIKVADQSVFHFEPVDTADIKTYKLFEYPRIYNTYQMDPVMGDNSSDAAMANKQLKYLNGLLGHKKQVCAFIMVFKNQPLRAGFLQENYWKGGNKNEFIICVGIDDERNVKWSKVISWTKNEELKVEVRDFVQEQKKLNLSLTVEYLQNKIENDFVRREFKEFDYLTVEPPAWGIALTFIITILVNVGVSFWVVKNEFSEEGNTNRFNYFKK